MKKSIKFFIENYIKKSHNVTDLLTKEHIIISKDDEKEFIKPFNKSTKGFIYERLWDICIKFGVTDLTKFDKVEHGFGNINNIHASVFCEFKDKFEEYLQENYISGNSGGYSDITFSTVKTLNLISVKYFEKEKDIKEYDIQNLCTIIENRKDDNKYDKINVILFVKNKKDFIKKINKSQKSSDILIQYISPTGNYENVYDELDLEICYSKLKRLFELYNYIDDEKIFKDKYLNHKKVIFKARFHQELFIHKINDLIHKKNKNILVGAMPRSGKTYIMAGTILEHVKHNNLKYNNYIIITPAPTETIQQYMDVFDNYIDFDKHNIKAIKVTNLIDIPQNNKHIVYVVSKQKLGYSDVSDCTDTLNIASEKLKVIQQNIEKYFGKNVFDIIFLDEAHHGMTTQNAQNIINILDNNTASKVYVTATYNKPNLAYNIKKHQKIIWNINDIKLLKNLNPANSEEIFNKFKSKFGVENFTKVYKNYHSIDSIIKQYSNFPEPYLITSVWDKDFLDEERKKIDGTDFSFDMNMLFTPDTKDKFIHLEQINELFHYYFGYPDKKREYKKQLFYKQRGILPRIENICNNNCRTLQTHRHKTSQLWFLPYGQGRKIKIVTNCLLHLLKNNFTNIFNKYMFYVAMDKKDRGDFLSENVQYMSKPANIKIEIQNIEKNLDKYDGFIILSGARLQLGISLNNVDIVTLFTGITSSDAIYQMMFRSMTEIDKDIECDNFNYCAQKKIWFYGRFKPTKNINHVK
jgi:hypothetical protein